MSKKLALIASFLPLAANAVNLQLMNHSHSPHYLVTEDTLSQNSLLNQRLILSANYNKLNDPLVATNQARTERTRTLIDDMTTIQIGAGWQTSSRFLVGISAPFTQVTFAESGEQNNGMGDTTLIGKYRVSTDYNPTSIALIPTLTLPTGDKNLFLSDGAVGVGLKLAMERDFGRFRLNGNIGLLRNEKAAFADIDYRNRFLAALGVHVPITDKWHVTSEAYTMISKTGEQSPAELVTAVQYYQNGAMSFSGGVGFGGFDKVTGNDWRIVVGLKWQPPVGTMRVIASSPDLTPAQTKALEKVSEVNLQVRFDHDSDVLDDDDRAAIKQMADLIKNAGLAGQHLIIQGHANSIGEPDYNRNLSLRRAQAVRKELIVQGLNPELTQAVGHGQDFPIQAENRRMTLDMSRRVDFIIQ